LLVRFDTSQAGYILHTKEIITISQIAQPIRTNKCTYMMKLLLFSISIPRKKYKETTDELEGLRQEKKQGQCASISVISRVLLDIFDGTSSMC
jgi:hypothetical protein